MFNRYNVISKLKITRAIIFCLLILFALVMQTVKANAVVTSLTSIYSGGTTEITNFPDNLEQIEIVFNEIWGITYDGYAYSGNITPDTAVGNVKKIQSASSNTGRTAFALKEDGTVWSWGGGKLLGRITGSEIGIVNYDDSSPAQLTGMPEIKDISAGVTNVLALDVNGEVWAWGNNRAGQIGDGSGACSIYDENHVDYVNECYRLTPTKVGGLSGIKQISTGESFGVALTNSGELMHWGSFCDTETYWDLYDTPTQYTGLSNIEYVESGYCRIAAITEEGEFYTWITAGVPAYVASQVKVEFGDEICTDTEEVNECRPRKAESVDGDGFQDFIVRDELGDIYDLGISSSFNPLSFTPTSLGSIGLEAEYHAYRQDFPHFPYSARAALIENHGNPVLTTPINLNSTSPTKKPELSWSSVNFATGYNVYRNGVLVGQTTSTSFVDNSASDGEHAYTVTATKDQDESSQSDAVSVLVDTVRPTITFTSPISFTGPFSPGPTVTVNASDASSGLKSLVIHVYKSNNQLLSTCGSANSTQLDEGTMSCNLASLPAGQYYIKAGTFDNANNNKTILSGSFTIQ